MLPALVVKNTFLDLAGEEGAFLSPVQLRRRARTAEARTLIMDSEGEEEDAPAQCEADACGPSTEAAAASPPPLGCAPPRAGCPAAARQSAASAEAAADALCATVREAIFHEEGCQIVLRELEAAKPEGVRRIAACLRGLAAEAARSAQGHQVLESLVHLLGTDDTAFIVEELACVARATALNPHGSSLLCRLLEHSAADPRMEALIQELLSVGVADLCCHRFGHTVALSVLSNGSCAQSARVVAALRDDVQRFARHRYASLVLGHILEHSPPEEGCALAALLMDQPGAVTSLARHAFGVQVVRSLLRLPGPGAQALNYLRKASKRVMKDRYGAALMEELGFSLEEPRADGHGVIGGA